MLTSSSLAFWAKTEGGRRDSASYHPLLFHMIDVAFTARAVWRQVLTSASREWLQRQLRLDPEATERWIAFIAGTHDVGKASPAFQHKSSFGWKRLIESGFPAVPPEGDEPHALVSAWCLQNEHTLADLGVDGEVVRRLAHVVGGHHGQIPCGPRVRELRMHEAAYGGGPWIPARHELIGGLAEAIGGFPLTPIKELPNPAAMALAGLITVSDWVGSNQQYFPCASDDEGRVHGTLSDYTGGLEERVRVALQTLGWLGWRPERPAHDFRSLFPAIDRPNSMQVAVERAATGVDRPSIFIIEAAMGEGKTEAAMYLANRWSSVLGQRGTYFAMPTQATSNQMFRRVRDFLSRTYPDVIVNLQLLHGLASLSGEFAEMKRGTMYSPEGVDIDDEHGDVVAAEWFAHRKRGLLAPFGVGTVDQAMYSVLQVRHVFVRLFALAQKTVILDEVHAYDTYMTTIIENLVRWLGSLGSSVVVLSATLPQEKREQLLGAYAEGIGQTASPLREPIAYPRVTWFCGGSSAGVHTGDRSGKARVVDVKWIDALVPTGVDGEFPLGLALQEVTKDGGCVAVICNTVRRAQDVFRALKPFFRSVANDYDPELDLFHARYTFRDRQKREERTLGRFGKLGAEIESPGGGRRHLHRPHRAVLVATQVIEQSLDLDFDLIVTDFAPADLLLQRLGRLHRHTRQEGRPTSLMQPTAWLLRPAVSEEGVPDFDRGTATVYDHYVLLRSWLALKDRSQIQFPTDIESTVEAVYGPESTIRGGLGQAFAQVLASARTKSEWDRMMAKNEAETREVKRPDRDGDLCELSRDGLEEEDPTLHDKLLAVTRLSGPSINVILLFGDDEFPRLDPAAESPVDLRNKPGLAEARDLLARSLTVTNPPAVHAILDNIKQPSGWADSALLRYHRPIVLDGQSRREVGDAILCYDLDLGLVIDPKGGVNV